MNRPFLASTSSKQLLLTWVLDTNIELRIENVWDWVVFCDIWVEKEYPLIVSPKPGRQPVIVDLGANVGYFSLLVAHECKRAGKTPKIISFEGDPETFVVLESRTLQCADVITPYHGLIGKREGIGYIAHSDNHATSLLDHEFGAPVSYLDIEDYIPYTAIDMIKCDIEGAEFDFVTNYKELLQRTDVVYMEIHNTKGDSAELHKHMVSYGFKHKLLSDKGDTTTEVFYR